MVEGATHISLPTQEYDRGNGENRKTNEQTRTKLGVNQSRRRYCNTTCMCRLSQAWVTSENSTSTGMPTSFDSIFFAGPYLVCYCLRSPVLTAPVRGSTPTLFARLSAVQRHQLSSGFPVNCLSAPLSSQLSFAFPYDFRIRRDFRSKNPLSGFAPKQTKESSTLAGYPYSATS